MSTIGLSGIDTLGYTPLKRGLVPTTALGKNTLGYTYTGLDADNKPLTSTDSSALLPGSISSAMGEGQTYNTTQEKGLFDSFNYGGATGNTGLGAMLGAGLDVGQLGLGIAGYLDRADMNKANKALINQQIADNKDTIAARVARREQINRDWGSKPTAGLGAIAPKVGV